MNSYGSTSLNMSSNKQQVKNASVPIKNTGTTSAGIANKNPNLNSLTLVKGQQIKAEVIDLCGNDIKIQFEHGEIASAKVNTDVPISIGEQITFKVEEVDISSISLKVMAENRQTSQSIIIDKALENANLPKNARNMLIVQELLNNQMSIDKDSLLNIIKQSLTLKEASAQTLVLMNKFGIPVNEKNVEQFNAYQNYEHRIVNGTLNLLNSLMESLSQASTDNFMKIHKLLINLCCKQAPYTNSEIEYPVTDPFSYSKTEEDIPISNNVTILGNTDKRATDVSSQELNGIKNMKFPIFSPMDSTVSIQEESSELNLPPLTSKASDSLILNDLLSKEEQNTLLKLLPSTIQEGFRDILTNNSSSVYDFLSEMKKHIEFMDVNKQKDLLKSTAYGSIIKEALLSQWTLRPNDLKKQGSIERFYDQLEEDFKELIQILNVTKETTNILMESTNKQVHNLQDNVDFMKTLNQIFPYVQIPLKLSNQTVHSELYVYKRKKAKTEDTENVSVLLHLDMDQLGPLDIHLDLLKTNIHTKIYTDTIETKHILNDHMDLLKTTLENKGYTFNCEIMEREKKIIQVTDSIKECDGEVQMKRYSFDIRA